MDIYSFMDLLLILLPEKNRKMIRYYGIYANKVDEKIQTRPVQKRLKIYLKRIRKTGRIV